MLVRLKDVDAIACQKNESHPSKWRCRGSLVVIARHYQSFSSRWADAAELFLQLPLIKSLLIARIMAMLMFPGYFNNVTATHEKVNGDAKNFEWLHRRVYREYSHKSRTSESTSFPGALWENSAKVFTMTTISATICSPIHVWECLEVS